MKVSAEDLRRQYAAMSDDGLLDINPDELVDAARLCYHEEMARRGLTPPQSVDEPDAAPDSASGQTAEPFVVAGTYESHDEAAIARWTLRSAGIRAQLGQGGRTVLVPASTREDAREVLSAEISEQTIADAATSGPAYVRHGMGTVRPCLYGHPDLLEFVQHVFGAVELERFSFSLSRCHVASAIGDSVIMLEIGDPPPEGAAPSTVCVYVPDVDEAFDRALQAGAEELEPPKDQENHERSAAVKDTFGNTWRIATYREA
jgi:uncharacterized glyoxalase superfamily protein PhnB